MTKKKNGNNDEKNTRSKFGIAGKIQLERIDGVPEELQLAAFAFDNEGKLIGKSEIDPDGQFNMPVRLQKPSDVDLIVSPDADLKLVRASTNYKRHFDSAEWIEQEERFRISPSVYVRDQILEVWWPRQICVDGHVRKVHVDDGDIDICPVPYVKVEIFDVDREGCWWPYILSVYDLLKDHLTISADRLLGHLGPPQEMAGPMPRPESPFTRSTFEKLHPQPEPPGFRLPQPIAGAAASWSERAAMKIKGQPGMNVMEQVGEITSMPAEFASGLQHLTINSHLEPWILFPWCFYSKQLVCTTYTDCDGYFRCCFPWFPWHFRRGRLRFDGRPDIIIKVTQVIDGVERVIYMDPYTSTRWNVNSAHIDVYLTDENVVCGPGCVPDGDLAEGEAAILRIGADPIWKINGTDGMYTVPPVDNAAYGGTLYVFGDFGPSLKDGAPPHYYRLSYAEAAAGGGLPADGDFTPIRTPFEMLRAPILDTFETYLLGPQEVNGTPDLYEVQDTNHWWMLSRGTAPYYTLAGGMLLGKWQTGAFESDEGTYWLRLEMFDQNGLRMDAVDFPNHQGDGTGLDPDPVPIMHSRQNVKVHIDNEPLTFSLDTPATNDCGVIPWTDDLDLQFTVHASQANGRVHRWDLDYVKGSETSESDLDNDLFNNGVSPVDEDVNGAPLLVGLTTTCAFSLILHAWSHVRGNWDFHDYGRKVYAIAIEKCEPCPPCDEE